MADWETDFARNISLRSENILWPKLWTRKKEPELADAIDGN